MFLIVTKVHFSSGHCLLSQETRLVCLLEAHFYSHRHITSLWEIRKERNEKRILSTNYTIVALVKSELMNFRKVLQESEHTGSLINSLDTRLFS